MKRTFIDQLRFNADGLIPAIIQDKKTQRVLTLCYMNRIALEKTLSEGIIYLFRRSQNKLMMKGGSSGNIQVVKTVSVDCANNSLLFEVRQVRAACHEGYFSCYYRRIGTKGTLVIREKRVFDPATVYTKGS